MLSSPREDQKVQTAQDIRDSSPFSSFFKVVDSIQGLNHLLDDISLDKINEADDHAKQLIHHLATLQTELETLKQIKFWLSKAKTSSEKTRHQTTRETDGEAVKSPSFPQVNPWPKNLIPFPGSARLSRAEKRPAPIETFLSPDANEAEKEQNETADLPAESGHSSQKHNDAIRPLTEQQSEDTFSIHLQHSTGIRKETTEKAIDSHPQGKAPKTKIDFDHRLLGDLIKDYGELSTHTRRAAEEKQSSDPASPSASEAHRHSVQHGEANAPTYELTQTRFRSEGDLDRRLKTIVRDYGEVDIYSCRTPDNIRKKVVIVTLILIMGYFASSLFFPVHQSENAATSLRLQSSTTGEVAKGSQREQMVDPLQPDRQPPWSAADQALPENPLEQTPSRQPGD